MQLLLQLSQQLSLMTLSNRKSIQSRFRKLVMMPVETKCPKFKKLIKTPLLLKSEKNIEHDKFAHDGGKISTPPPWEFFKAEATKMSFFFSLAYSRGLGPLR